MEASFLVPQSPPPMVGVTEGEHCLALFHADHSYHRGHIISVLNDKCQIEFIDYGNTELLSLLYLTPLTDVSLSLPAQALPCSLAGAPEDIVWDFDSCIKFSRLVLEKEVKLVVKV